MFNYVFLSFFKWNISTYGLADILWLLYTQGRICIWFIMCQLDYTTQWHQYYSQDSTRLCFHSVLPAERHRSESCVFLLVVLVKQDKRSAFIIHFFSKCFQASMIKYTFFMLASQCTIGTLWSWADNTVFPPTLNVIYLILFDWFSLV